MLKKILIELEKRFSKNGDHRRRLNYLKDLKKEYPKNEMVSKLIQIFKQKIYGINGATFLYENFFKLPDVNVLFQNGIFEVEGVKFDLSSSSAREVFFAEFLDLFCIDDHFKKSKENELFYQIMKDIHFSIGEGPYQYNSVALSPNSVVIDAGANLGIFSILANHFYKAECYAFEPVQSTIKLLEKNIKLNRMEDAIKVVPYGLNDKECDLDIQTDECGIGSSSFVRNPKKCVGMEKIHCITLDQWVQKNNISKIDFIKADIEGAERNMLLGATEVLKKNAPKLSICTYHLPDDPQILEEIILRANPNYKIEHAFLKLYAYVPNGINN